MLLCIYSHIVHIHTHTLKKCESLILIAIHVTYMQVPFSQTDCKLNNEIFISINYTTASIIIMLTCIQNSIKDCHIAYIMSCAAVKVMHSATFNKASTVYYSI